MRNPRATGLGRSGRTYSTAQLATGSEDVEDDASFGRTRENPGADRGEDLPPGPVVAPAGHRRHPAEPVGRVRHGPGVHGPLLLGAGLPLPDPVLLALHQRRVRARLEHPGPLVPGGPADHPLRGDLAAVRAGLPADLLLLPPGLLPRLLAGAGRVRGARAAREVHPRDPVPADHAEPAPVLLLRRDP